jgi:hypothetical protein
MAAAMILYTVTRTTQNEALPWKITDLGIGEAHLLVPEHFVPRPCWYLTFLHAGNIFLLQEQDILPCKCGKIP